MVLYLSVRPGPVFRGMVIATQWIFTGGFSLAYLISPHFCHRSLLSQAVQECGVIFAELWIRNDLFRIGLHIFIVPDSDLYPFHVIKRIWNGN